jgi:hypothetical protein
MIFVKIDLLMSDLWFCLFHHQDWRRIIDDFCQDRSFDVRSMILLIPSSILRFSKKPIGPAEIRTHNLLGSNFSIIIFSVLSITATRLLEYVEVKWVYTDLNNMLDLVDFWNRDEYDLCLVKLTLCFFKWKTHWVKTSAL